MTVGRTLSSAVPQRELRVPRHGLATLAGRKVSRTLLLLAFALNLGCLALFMADISLWGGLHFLPILVAWAVILALSAALGFMVRPSVQVPERIVDRYAPQSPQEASPTVQLVPYPAIIPDGSLTQRRDEATAGRRD